MAPPGLGGEQTAPEQGAEEMQASRSAIRRVVLDEPLVREVGIGHDVDRERADREPSNRPQCGSCVLEREPVARAQAFEEGQRLGARADEDVLAVVDDRSRGRVGPRARPAARLGTGLEHRDPGTGRREGGGRREPREAGPDHDGVRDAGRATGHVSPRRAR